MRRVAQTEERGAGCFTREIESSFTLLHSSFAGILFFRLSIALPSGGGD